MQRIMIVDPHPLIGNGISHILETNGYNVIARETNGDDAIKSAFQLHPELMIMDLHLPDYHGLEVIRVVRDVSADMKIIVLTAYNDFHYQLRCRELGVEGYMLKTELTETLIKVIEVVNSGGLRYPPLDDTQTADRLGVQGVMLTRREKTILNYLSSGMNNREIAGKLSISDKTVSTHKRRIMAKFDATNIVDLLSKARSSTSR